jgi:hypothetical protein
MILISLMWAPLIPAAMIATATANLMSFWFYISDLMAGLGWL